MGVTLGVLSAIVGLVVFAFTRKPVMAWIWYNQYRKTMKLIFTAELIISIIGFYLLYVTTEPPTGGSGNGNPFLVFFGPITLGVSIHSCILLAAWIRKKLIHHPNRKIYVSSLIFLSLVIIACTVLELQFAERLSQKLGGSQDPHSVIYRYPFLNVYTNSVLFNLYTFLGLYSISSFIGITISFKKNHRLTD
ncbi:MAG TPA: hypothetical protein VFK33_09390 [Bacillales bacterium]|nr:hypothetical protein [Bacillales bacterium]